MADPNYLTLIQLKEVKSGPMYVLRTKKGTEIAHIFTVDGKWTIWSGGGFFNGLAKYPHDTLLGMMQWILAVVQVPIVITGGKTDGKTGTLDKTAA